MKCACGSTLKEIKTELELLDGDVMLKNVDAYYCPKCKEEVLTSGQIEAARQKITIPIEAFHVHKKIIKVGNTYAIPISKEIIEFVQAKKGTPVELIVKDRKRLIAELA